MCPDMPLSIQLAARKIMDYYAPQLARQIFDYTFAACMGEARHAYKRVEEPIYVDYFDDVLMDYGYPPSRDSVYRKCEHYDPENCLVVLIELFENYKWEDAYGGDSWGNIAQQAYKYLRGELTDEIYIDIAVDLHHNGGVYLDKGYIIYLGDPEAFQDFLDYKAQFDILKDEWDYMAYVSEPVGKLIRNIPHVKVNSSEKTILNGFEYRPVEYGTKVIEIKEIEDITPIAKNVVVPEVSERW